MKIAIVGCGALGSYYGALLCQAGHETHFLLRSDYEVVRRDGIVISSPEGETRARPKCARRPEEIGPADLVAIGLKTTGNRILPEVLPPLVGKETLVLTLQNGLGNEAAVAAVVGKERTLGGLCFVCLNRVAPGKIVHSAHGIVVMGEYDRPSEARTHAMAKMFVEAKIECRVTDELAKAHWEKLVWNIPFNGLGVAGTAGLEAMEADAGARGTNGARSIGACLTTADLLGNARWESLVRELMAETIGAAQALGFDIPDSVAEYQINRTRKMGAYKASTLIDFERGQPLELETLFAEPLRQAKAAGASCPRLERLCEVLGQLAGKA